MKRINQELSELVEYRLAQNSLFRDNDQLLIASIWSTEMKRSGFYPSQHTAHELLELLANGKLPNPESIRRCRQKLQELKPELRGKKYKLRKILAEETRKEFGK